MALFGLFGPSETDLCKTVDKMQKAFDIHGLIGMLSNRYLSVRRLAIQALGKLGDARAVDPVLNNLWWNHRLNPVAAETLGKIGDPRAVAPLINAIPILSEYDKTEREAIFYALGRFDDTHARDCLVAILKNENQKHDCRMTAAESLTFTKEGCAILLLVLKDSNWLFRKIAAQSLKNMGLEPNDPALLARFYIETDNWQAASSLGAPAVMPLCENIRSQSWSGGDPPAMKALQEIREPQAADLLLAALQDDDSRIQRAAMRALGNLRETRAVNPLLEILANTANNRSGSNGDVFRAAAEALGNIGDPFALESLIGYFKSKECSIGKCKEVAEALGKIGSERAIEALLEAVKTENEYYRSSDVEACWNALAHLGHPDGLKHIANREMAEKAKMESDKAMVAARKRQEEVKKTEMEATARRTGYRCQHCGGGVEPRNQKCPWCGIDLIFFARK